MSLTDRLFPRQRANGAAPAARSAAPAVVPSGVRPAAPSPPASASAPASVREDLQAHRHALAQELADRQWDLGGLTYEMAIRDHFRLDVLQLHAAKLQEIDAELAEIERLLRLDEAAAAGECEVCRAPHSRGAAYCWSCGAQLIPQQGART